MAANPKTARKTLRGNTRISYYDAGHMTYIRQPSLKTIKEA
jgi:carboxypeptidase C (cathepsin A)